MAQGNLGSLPLFQAFRGPRKAYARRVAIVSVIVVGVLGVSAWSMLGHKVVKAPTTVASIPPVNTLPGGPNGSPYYRQVSEQAARRSALQAQHQGLSSVTPFPPSDAAPEPTPALPKPAMPTIAQPTPVHYDPPAPASPSSGPQINATRYRAYQGAINQVLASLGPVAPMTSVYIKPKHVPADSSGTPGTTPATSAALAGTDSATTGASTKPVDPASATSLAPVLISAGHGVYARVLVGGNSDQPGPIVVVAESGPIAGDRMIGNFARMHDRLVVHLNSLSTTDGQEQSINAIMVAPDSMQTAVATSVNEHYVTRFFLPVAAAFVEGLGQAIQESNSVIQSTPLGGINSYNHLNLGQQMGVAAGVAGQTAGALIQEAAPHGPTVKLASGSDVGVLFLSPLKATTPSGP
jgi:intracellular multiplication protein IcmE